MVTHLFHKILVQLIKEPLEGLAIDEAVWKLLSNLRETKHRSNKHPAYFIQLFCDLYSP